MKRDKLVQGLSLFGFIFLFTLHSAPSSFGKQKSLFLYSLRQNKTKALDTAPFFSSFRCLRSDSDWERICHFKNVCFDTRDRVFDYFCDSSKLPLLFAGSYGMEPFSNNASFCDKGLSRLKIPLQLNYDKFSWEKSLLPLRVVPSPLNYKNVYVDEKEIHVVFQSFWAENFGHALGDDVLPIFSLMKHFGFLEAEPQAMMLGYHNLDSLGDRARAQRFLMDLTKLITPFPLLDMNQEPPFANSSKYRHVCVSNLLAGHGRLGMKTDRGFAWNEFAETAMKRATHLWPLVQKARDVLITSHKILILIKVGRRSMLNSNEVEQYLSRVFEIPVQSIDPSQYSFEEQLILAQEATVLVTPCGGISFFGAFLRNSAAIVVLGFWNPETNSSNNMEDFFWRHNSRLSASLFYDVRPNETTILHPGNSSRKNFEDLRNYGAITINVMRMARIVDSALQSAALGFGLKNPSYSRRFQHEYANIL